MTEDDDDLSALLDDYLEPPPPAPNPDYADVDIEIDPRILDKHWRKHGITEHDVRDAILGQPPAVEQEAHEDPEKRVFRSFTRYGHYIFIVGVWVESTVVGRRRLRIATAFPPDDDNYYR